MPKITIGDFERLLETEMPWALDTWALDTGLVLDQPVAHATGTYSIPPLRD